MAAPKKAPGPEPVAAPAVPLPPEPVTQVTPPSPQGILDRTVKLTPRPTPAAAPPEVRSAQTLANMSDPYAPVSYARFTEQIDIFQAPTRSVRSKGNARVSGGTPVAEMYATPRGLYIPGAAFGDDLLVPWITVQFCALPKPV